MQSTATTNNVFDKIVTINVDGQPVRLNVMQPLRVKIVYDQQLPAAKRSDTLLSTFKKLPQGGLPKATFSRVNDYITEREPFEMPDEYITFQPKSESDLLSAIEYDADEEDLEWISLVNEKLARKKDHQSLSITQFEAAMDRMEKESFFQSSKDGVQCGPSIDQDAVCCICNDGDGCNANQIIFCDLCNIAVHQDCYGVPYIPEGQWLCRRCQLSPSKPVQCQLCPSTHGAFKRTVSNQWAHVVCALWLNEVHFANTVFMEPIDGIENSLKRRCRLRCMVCKQKMGACLQCSKKSCTRSYHVTCARAAGMELRAEEVKNPTNEWGTDVKYLSYCHFHSNPLNKENLNAREIARKKREVEALMRLARQQLQSNENIAPTISIPVVPSNKVEEIRTKLKINAEIMHRLLVYWTIKRKSRSGVPLLKRLMQTKIISREVETTRDSARDLAANMEHKSFYLLRNDLERVRLLCELVKKREKFKREYLKETSMAIEYLTKPLSLQMNELIDKIAAKDYQNVFANPVSEKDVPGYSSIIKKPMDLSKMRKKVAKGEYKHLGQLKSDFILMINNCSTFNRHNEFFWKYGHRLQRIALKYFSATEKNIAFINVPDDSLKAFSNIRSLLWERAVKTNDGEILGPKRGIKREKCNSSVADEASSLTSTTSRNKQSSGIKDVKNEPSCSGLQSGNTSAKVPSSATQRSRRPSSSATTQVTNTRKRLINDSGIAPSDGSSGTKRSKTVPTPASLSQLPITRFLVPFDVSPSQNEDESKLRRSTRPRRSSVLTPNTSSAFKGYRSRPVMSPSNELTTTDNNSSAVDESASSAAEECSSWSRRCAANNSTTYSVRQRRTTRSASRPFASRRRSSRRREPFIDTVEIGQDFQHDDIIWVEDQESRTVGHVIDICLKVLLDSYPVDEMLAKRPRTDPGQYILVQLFDKHHTWRWVPLKCVSHCDLSKANSFTSSHSSAMQSAINEARKFRDARL